MQFLYQCIPLGFRGQFGIFGQSKPVAGLFVDPVRLGCSQFFVQILEASGGGILLTVNLNEAVFFLIIQQFLL